MPADFSSKRQPTCDACVDEQIQRIRAQTKLADVLPLDIYVARVLAPDRVNRHRYAHKIVPIYNSRFRLRDTEIAEDGADVDNFLSSDTRRLAFCF